jgi:hypothetical protein
VRFKVAAVALVFAALLLIVIEPVGAVVSPATGVALAVAPVEEFPAASDAHTR